MNEEFIKAAEEVVKNQNEMNEATKTMAELAFSFNQNFVKAGFNEAEALLLTAAWLTAVTKH